MSTKTPKWSDHFRKSYILGEDDDYSDMMKTMTESEAMRLFPYKQSEYKKPYLAEDYPSMEGLYTEPLHFRFEQTRIPRLPLLEEEWPCWCLGARGFPIDLGRVSDCQMIEFRTVLVCGDEGISIQGVDDDEIDVRCSKMNIPHIGWVASNLLFHSYTSDAPFPSPPCTEIRSQCCMCIVTITPDCNTGFDCNGERIITITEPNGNTYELIIGGIDCSNVTIGGTAPLDQTTSNASKQYMASAACGGVWSVTGTGFSISQSGLLTTSSGCGTGIITYTSCGYSDTQEVRVTDSGQWGNQTWLASCLCSNPPDGDWPCYSECNVHCYTYTGKYKYDDLWFNLIEGKEYNNCQGVDPVCSATCGDGENMRHWYLYRYEWVC